MQEFEEIIKSTHGTEVKNQDGNWFTLKDAIKVALTENERDSMGRVVDAGTLKAECWCTYKKVRDGEALNDEDRVLIKRQAEKHMNTLTCGQILDVFKKINDEELDAKRAAGKEKKAK